MLKVENLSIHFEDRGGNQEVVKNVSFALQDSEILGIVGESGSGKTMTALTIAGTCFSTSNETAIVLS